MSRKAKKTRVHRDSPSASGTSDTQQKPPDPSREAPGTSPFQDGLQEGWLLALSLNTAVPIAIDTLYQDFRGRGGIPPWMVGEAVEFSQVVAERGDKLLFRSERKGETANLFASLARALSILSFFPGGVTFLTATFEALKQLKVHYEEQEAQAFCQVALRPYFDAVITKIPVVCWSGESEPGSLGTYNALHWLEQATDADILQLRDASFHGCAIWTRESYTQAGYEQTLLAHLFDQARSRSRWLESPPETPEAEGAQRFLTAHDNSQEILYQFEVQAAEAWLALYKHALLTGERWLLPPEPTRKKTRSGNRSKS